MKQKFGIRAVQMDLARQMETIGYVFNFIDFIAKYGCNTLFLYVEWRIRTATFDIGEGNGYTMDEIRQIVAYASEKGIEVIPGLACFGHAEQVLNLPEYEDFAELRGGIEGREHSSFRHVFCLTNPLVREFIGNYLSEIAELFPGKYIHAGFDEALDVGYCSECARKSATFESEEELVFQHLDFCRRIISKKYGKQMMIWDDLLTEYPLLLEKMSRDIVICSWQYQQNVPTFCSYCFNATARNTLHEFSKAGFQFVIVPVDLSLTGAETFTAWGEREGALGGLLSAWGKTTFFHERTKLTTAACCLLWSGKAANAVQAFRMVVSDIFGEQTEEICTALQLTRCAAYRVNLIQGKSALMTHSFFGPDEKELLTSELVYEVLSRLNGKYPEDLLPGVILSDILSEAKTRSLSLRSSRAAYRILHGLEGESLSAIAKEIPAAFAPMIQMCGRLRGSDFEKSFIATRDNWIMSLEGVEKDLLKPHSLCRVMFCLPLTYGNMRTVITSRLNGKETVIGKGIFKISNGFENYPAHFEYNFILPADFDADTLKIEMSGFGGSGISFATIFTPEAKLVPYGIVEVSGEVASPQNLLSETDTFCYFGDQDGLRGVKDRKSAETTHSVELILQKV